MAKRKRRRRGATSVASAIGRLSTQPVVVRRRRRRRTGTSTSGRGAAGSLGSRTRGTARAVGRTSRSSASRPSVTAVFSRTNPRGTPSLTLRRLAVRSPLTITAAAQRIPIRLASRIPLFRIQRPLLLRPAPEKFSEDVLDVSETRLVNSQFVPIERNGISSFRPEIIQITDFLPIWKDRSKARYLRDFSATGKLIDTQYNALWLRRDTLVNLLKGMSQRNEENTRRILGNIRNNWQRELRRTDRTIRWYGQFLDQIEVIKKLLDLKDIPRSQFDRNLLPLDDFFDRRMQFSKDKLDAFSDTKIILQLLADFKQIAENYSVNLLDLEDSDRTNDYNPVSIDTTYTLNDGFTFTIDQIRSRTTPVNATQRAFFNTFLNSLPNDPDDRLRLLLAILSKEYRISRSLGIPQVQRKLSDVFASGDTGSPFDNIIGIPGANIFEQPLGENSLASLFVRPLNDNAVVLPLEKKYIDSDDSKKTFIPGSGFFVDTVLDVQGNDFNTQPYVNYADQVSNRFNEANNLIQSMFNLGQQGTLQPDAFVDFVYTSFRDSIIGMTNLSNLNRDQAIIAAIFKLANTDNELKNRLFQFCLLAGLASNSVNDQKPVFRELAREFRNIRAFPGVRTTKRANPNLSGGIRTLRPYIQRLAADIENRVIALTTPAPRFNLGLVLRANPDFTRFRTTRSPRDVNLSAYARLSVAALTFNQSTINIPRFTIRRILLSNVDPKTSSSTNLIKEFIDIANAFTQAAAYNGESVYLLDDQTGRTRFNFISTSTQLLLLFEILSSMTAKFSFAKFGRSRSIFNAFVTIDAQKNEFVVRSINDIITVRPILFTRGIARRALTRFPRAAIRTLTSTRTRTASTYSRFLTPTFTRILRSGDSTTNTSRTATAGSTLSLINNPGVTALVNQRLSSPYLGSRLLQRIGPLRLGILNFTRDTINLRSSLSSTKNKVITEDKIIANMVDILSVVEERIRNGKNKMVNFFNPQILSSFLQENTLEDLAIVRNPSQVRAAAFIQREARNRSRALAGTRQSGITFNFLVDDEVVFPTTRNALFSMLSEPEFLIGSNADLRTKVITVGIPSGFSQQLSDRIERADINKNTFKDKQFDVVAVKVYKRDQRFEDIVFKPKTFLFDLSLFQEEDLIFTQARQNERYSRIVQRNRIIDLESILNPKTRNLANIVNDDDYDFLSTDQKRELIGNHTSSALLELYIRMLTGMRIDEATFAENVVQAGTAFSEEFVNLVFTYLRDTLDKEVPNQPIPQLLTNSDVDDETKDILRLITYGNVVFEPEVLRSKVISPKLFDRVFHLAFNTEDFEIDEEETMDSESGKLAMQKSVVQERIVEEGNSKFLRPKNRNELVFEDYFVVVENSI